MIQQIKKRLGDMLVEEGLIDEFQLTSALAAQRKWGGRLGTNLIRMEFLGEDDLIRFLSRKLGLPAVDFSTVDISPNVLATVSEEFARENSVLPISIKKNSGLDHLYLAMSEPTNIPVIDEVRAKTGMNVKPVVASDSGLNEAINVFYSGGMIHSWRKDSFIPNKYIDPAVINDGVSPDPSSPPSDKPDLEQVDRKPESSNTVTNVDAPSNETEAFQLAQQALDIATKAMREAEESRALILTLSQMLIDREAINLKDFVEIYNRSNRQLEEDD
jgi:MshEN domain